MSRSLKNGRSPSVERKETRLNRRREASVSNWSEPPSRFVKATKENAFVDCGWGKLIFGHTFKDQDELVRLLVDEEPNHRNIALYLRDPHVILSKAPQQLFLDPSHTYRVRFERYRPSKRTAKGYYVRRIKTKKDIDEINRIYASRNMVTLDRDFVWSKRSSKEVVYLVVEDIKTKSIVGTVLGVDHYLAFKDPERGSSLWALAVCPKATNPGIGETLTRYLIEFFQARERNYLDLSVMHNNKSAIRMYEKLNFERIPVFCIKKKNAINESLFIAPALSSGELNPYAEIIIKEARRRGVEVQVLDAERALFRLSFGGRSILCHESLTELTNALAVKICDDKQLTHDFLKDANLKVPRQQYAGKKEDNESFLESVGSLVVKPLRGEQGRGITVDVRRKTKLKEAISAAKEVCPDVLLEEFVRGTDLRVVVIDFKVVAASTRIPPKIVGTGKHTIRSLIQKVSRRREAATKGESKVPIDAQTEACVRDAGYKLDSTLPEQEELYVRKTANLHTGGSMYDVTDQLCPELIEVSENAAKVIGIPVVGLDLIVESPSKPTYWLIEANERVGLANHEPQPTAERFIDLLFPQTKQVLGSELRQ